MLLGLSCLLFFRPPPLAPVDNRAHPQRLPRPTLALRPSRLVHVHCEKCFRATGKSTSVVRDKGRFSCHERSTVTKNKG